MQKKEKKTKTCERLWKEKEIKALESEMKEKNRVLKVSWGLEKWNQFNSPWDILFLVTL